MNEKTPEVSPDQGIVTGGPVADLVERNHQYRTLLYITGSLIETVPVTFDREEALKAIEKRYGSGGPVVVQNMKNHYDELLDDFDLAFESLWGLDKIVEPDSRSFPVRYKEMRDFQRHWQLTFFKSSKTSTVEKAKSNRSRSYYRLSRQEERYRSLGLGDWPGTPPANPGKRRPAPHTAKALRKMYNVTSLEERSLRHTRTKNPGYNRDTPPYVRFLSSEDTYGEIDPSMQTTAMELVSLAGQNMQFGEDVSSASYQHAEPGYIESGLYEFIPRDSKQKPAKNAIGCRVYGKPINYIVFPFGEWDVIRGSASGLGRKVYNKTRDIHFSDEDREAADATSNRASGHALFFKIMMQDRMSAALGEDKQDLVGLREHIKRPNSRKLLARTIVRRLVLADEKIHEAAELASEQLAFEDIEDKAVAVNALHEAVRNNIFGPNLTDSQRAHNLISYINILEDYLTARIQATKEAQHRCEIAYQDYKPYLDKYVRATAERILAQAA